MSIGRSYRLTPRADADLEGIWHYSFEHWSAEQADTYVGSIISAFAELAAGARNGHALHEHANFWRCSIGSHAIFYREHPTHIEIVRILHQGMDAERHL